jgi:ribosomal protein S12 methylthiotransferase
MSEMTATASLPTSQPAPKVGFVSLGCPKALTDSELILTQLSAEGYQTSKTFEGADLVIVNTCGFIDEAIQESLDTIAEALNENGKVIVTGCLGAKTGEGGGNMVREMHPSVLAVTGPHATFKQGFGFFEHIANRARDQVTPHGRDDAKSAAVVAALADF